MILWEIARASGFVAIGALTATVLWGILLAGRAFRPAAPQLAAHRFLTSLAFAAIAVHVGTLLADRHAHVPLTALVGAAPPAWLAGVAALWLALAMPLTVAARGRGLLTAGRWRRLHRLAYAAWLLAWVHGMAAGTDTGSPWAVAAYGAAGMVVAGCAAWRWSDRPRTPVPARAGGTR